MILLTNDDGIGSPGIELTRRFLEGLGEEVLVVAPDLPVSQCGHSITTDDPMRIEERAARVYALAGMPADCVRVGLTQLMPEGKEASWVVSGLNYGANLGVDVYVSGTVAAAREAALLGVRAVAFSVYHRAPIDLGKEFPVEWMEKIWRRISSGTKAKNNESGFWNVNFPHPEEGMAEPEIVFCDPSRKPLPVEYRREGDAFHYAGNFSARAREMGSDVDHCFGGSIAVSRVAV